MSPSNHLREQSLLQLCSSQNLSEQDTVRLSALVREVSDWPYVMKWAGRHRILPALHLNLKHMDGVPAEVSKELQHTYFLNASQNLRLSGELIRLTALLQKEGIEVISFKGPLLAERVYGTVSSRQFGDLDLLVKPADVARARQILLADGYIPEFNLEGKIESEYLKSEHAFQFEKRGCGFVVELHWRFGSRDQAFPISSDDVWKTRVYQTFQGRDLLALSAEDLFLYLCMHGAKHGWDRLEWISCLHAFMRAERNNINWAEVHARAERDGALRGVHLAMLLAGNIGPTGVPDEYLAAAQSDAAAERLACHALERLFCDDDHSAREVSRHAFYLRSRERMIDQVRIVFFSVSRIPHPLAKDWSLFRIPASMSFLYYLLRPMRLLREHGLPRLRAVLRPGTTIQEGKYL